MLTVNQGRAAGKAGARSEQFGRPAYNKRLPVVSFLPGYYWTTELSLVGGRVLHSYE